MKLKRARLADDLNEKIAQRPGPMELVEKNILPVESGVEEVIINGRYSSTLLYPIFVAAHFGATFTNNSSALTVTARKLTAAHQAHL